MHQFYAWLVGKPIPVWAEFVITTCLVAAIWHWSHIIKWCINGDIWKDDR